MILDIDVPLCYLLKKLKRTQEVGTQCLNLIPIHESKMSEAVRLAVVYAVLKERDGFISYKVEHICLKPKKYKVFVQEAYSHTAHLSIPTNLSLLMLYLSNGSV
jgi:hypothetical protein